MKKLLLLLVLSASAQVSYQIPLYNNKTYTLVGLGTGLSVSNGILNVTMAGSDFVPAPNQVLMPLVSTPAYILTCPIADIYRDGLLQTENGVDYTLSLGPLGTVITFNGSSVPGAGDVIKIIYRCHA